MLGLALSGGGFRATLFHVGSLIRLNDAGVLHKVGEVTSVSGGSIIAAHLALRWKSLQFDGRQVAVNFDEEIVLPIRNFCSRTIDVGAILGGILSPIRHPSNLLTGNYRKHLYGDKTLQDLPAPGEGPWFTIYATSLQTGASVRLSRDKLGEWHLGNYAGADVCIATAVGASSAFPPPLCPVKLKLDASRWTRTEISDLHDDNYLKSTMLLGDGGIYDNMGLERLMRHCDEILVSDAGAPFNINRKFKAGRISQVARTKRALDIMGNQVRALRVRHLMRSFETEEKRGAYWGIGTRIGEYPLADLDLGPALVADSDVTHSIGDMRTRLNKFSPEEQGQLINWGYALADAALRSRYNNAIVAAASLPVNSVPI